MHALECGDGKTSRTADDDPDWCKATPLNPAHGGFCIHWCGCGVAPRLGHRLARLRPAPALADVFAALNWPQLAEVGGDTFLFVGIFVGTFLNFWLFT